MTDFSGRTRVAVPPDALYDYLAQVSNLPDYFARVTSATCVSGEQVRTTATLEGGREVEGEAWFRVDAEARRVEWGAIGPHDYRGALTVWSADAAEESDVEVSVHTTRADAGDPQVERGITDTLEGIRLSAERRLR